jgi:hypothetical protein
MTAARPTRSAENRPGEWSGNSIASAGLLLALVALVALPVVAQTPQDKIAIPGGRVGRWDLNMSVQDLIRTNGLAGPRPSVATEYVPRMTWYSWDHLGVGAGSHDRRKVEFLAVYAVRDLITERGVSIKSSRRAVLAAYGSPELEGDIFVQGKIIPVLIYNKIGLALFLNEDAVDLMLIFRPGEGGDLISLCGA